MMLENGNWRDRNASFAGERKLAKTLVVSIGVGELASQLLDLESDRPVREARFRGAEIGALAYRGDI